MLTLKTYAHALREEEADLSFADFEAGEANDRGPDRGPRRHHPAPELDPASKRERATERTARRP